jgi:hypothetical protein
MAKQNESIPSSEEHTVNEVYTKHGDLGARFGYHTYESEEDGRDITKRVIEHFESPQGTVVGPHDIMGQRAGGAGLATCDKCEEEIHSVFSSQKARTSLCPAITMRRCQRCRANLCERHYFISRFDNLPRCKWHDLLHRLYHTFLISLCFRKT